jgi:hypothetical protein
MASDDLKRLIVLNNPTEAELLRGLLEAQGIQVMLSKEAAATVYGLTAGAFAEVEVFVSQAQAAQAQEILDEYFRSNEPASEED